MDLFNFVAMVTTAGTQNVSYLVCHPKIYYRVHHNLPLSSVLRQMDPVHISKYFFKIHIEVIVPSKFRPPKCKEKRAIYSSDVRVFIANFCLHVVFQLRGSVTFHRLSSQTFLLQGSFLQIPQVFPSQISKSWREMSQALKRWT